MKLFPVSFVPQVPRECAAFGCSTRHRCRSRLATCRALYTSVTKNAGPLHLKSVLAHRGNRCRAPSRVACNSLPGTSSATGSVLRKGSETEVRWGTFISESQDLQQAVDEAVCGILDSIGTDSQPELAVLFVSSSQSTDFSNLVPYLRQKLPSLKYIFGCSGSGVLGGTADGPKEVVDATALSLTLGRLPGVKISLKHTLRSAIPSEDAAPDAWCSFVGLPDARDKNTSFFILCDHSFQHWEKIIQGLDYAFQGSKTLGGQLSLGERVRTRGLFCWSADEVAAIEARRAAAIAARAEAESSANGNGGGWLSRLANFIGVNGSDDEDELEVAPSGLHRYGAVIMGIQGDVQLDILSHEGFRFMSEKTYVVEEAYGNTVFSVREDTPGSSKKISPCEMLIEVLEPQIRKRVAEAEEQEDGDAGIFSLLHEVFPDMAVALAPSRRALNKEGLELDDFSLLGISGLNGEDGHMQVYSISNTQVTPGQRLKLVTVDSDAVTDDLRQRMLSYKRRELQDVMSGRALPPAFGALLLTNQAVGSGKESESSTQTVFNFMPVPTSGVLLSNQFATDKNNKTKTTHAGVLAIMRSGAKPLKLAEVVDTTD